MPFLEAPPIPPKNDSGTEITSAQGHDITRKVSALISHVGKLAINEPGITRGGSTARSTAAITTAGVYILANLVMNCSLFDLFSLEFSTSSSILDTVDSPKVCVTSY